MSFHAEGRSVVFDNKNSQESISSFMLVQEGYKRKLMKTSVFYGGVVNLTSLTI